MKYFGPRWTRFEPVWYWFGPVCKTLDPFEDLWGQTAGFGHLLDYIAQTAILRPRFYLLRFPPLGMAQTRTRTGVSAPGRPSGPVLGGAGPKVLGWYEIDILTW